MNLTLLSIKDKNFASFHYEFVVFSILSLFSSFLDVLTKVSLALEAALKLELLCEVAQLPVQ